MNFDVLLEELGTRSIQILLDGWYSEIESRQEDIASMCRYDVWNQTTIIEVIDELACLKVLREQYDEIHKAFEEYQKEE